MSKNFRNPKEGCWPTPAEMLLLRACLLQGAPAFDAWLLWRKHANFDALDGASYRLVPLLYHNLRDELADDPLLPKIKGMYRHTWTRNQLLFHAVADILQALDEGGIRALLLKGGALAAVHYRDAGLRPMGDFDFMVKPEDAMNAFALLERLGWQCAESVPLRQLLWCTHAAKFKNHRGQEVDIHWYLLPDGRQPGVDDAIWQDAETISFAGRNVLCANATDLLLHVCAHGAIGDIVRPIRWIADAQTILANSTGRVDWDRLVTLSQRRELTLTMARTLEFLREEFGAPVPDQVTEALHNTPRTWVERWSYRIKASPRGLSGALPVHCVNYLKLTAANNFAQKIAGLPLFFRRVWGLERTRDLPIYVVQKLWKRPSKPSVPARAAPEELHLSPNGTTKKA